MMKGIEFEVLDAFSDTPLDGNPVGVFLGADTLSPAMMQRIAQEMHLSECVFLSEGRSLGSIQARIFTPVNELPFAGHPTLGAAPVAARVVGQSEFVMETAQETLNVQATKTQEDTWRVEMSQPSPIRLETDVEGARAVVGLSPSSLPSALWTNGPRHFILPVESVETLYSLTPDHRALAGWDNVAFNLVAQDPDGHWELRMFSPAYGVVEDAATGSAAGCLAAHLAEQGLVAEDDVIEVRQGRALDRQSVMLPSASRRNGQWQITMCGDVSRVATGSFRSPRPQLDPHI